MVEKEEEAEETAKDVWTTEEETSSSTRREVPPVDESTTFNFRTLSPSSPPQPSDYDSSTVMSLLRNHLSTAWRRRQQRLQFYHQVITTGSGGSNTTGSSGNERTTMYNNFPVNQDDVGTVIIFDSSDEDEDYNDDDYYDVVVDDNDNVLLRQDEVDPLWQDVLQTSRILDRLSTTPTNNRHPQQQEQHHPNTSGNHGGSSSRSSNSINHNPHRRYYVSTRTRMVRRLLLRPIAIFLFGFCFLQFKDMWTRKQEMQQQQQQPQQSQMSSTTSSIGSVDMDKSNNSNNNNNMSSSTLPSTLPPLHKYLGNSLHYDDSTSSWSAPWYTPLFSSTKTKTTQNRKYVSSEQHSNEGKTTSTGSLIQTSSTSTASFFNPATTNWDINDNTINHNYKNNNNKIYHDTKHNNDKVDNHKNGDDHDPDNQDQSSNNNDDDGNNNKDDVNGWQPDMYPNPLLDPVQCGIDYLLADGSSSSSSTSSSTTSDEANNDQTNGTLFSSSVDADARTFVNSNPTPQQQSSSSSLQEDSLRLCDPDWVLGGMYLEEIANAMRNFSSLFTLPPHHGNDNNNNNNKKLVPPQQRSRRRLGHTKSLAATSRKHVGGYYQNDPYTNFEIEAASSDQAASSSSLSYTEKDVSEAASSSAAAATAIRPPGIALAVATVRKMNVPAVLRQGSYYAYEDEDDMVNDAAQIFARYLHDQWWPTPSSSSDTTTNNHNNNNPNHYYDGAGEFGILIFLSIQDRVCFISTGNAISTVLPWWRLEHIVSSMKPDLRHRDYGNALLTAIDDLTNMLQAGPPTFQDRIHDFMARFGVVIAFAVFTFLFGAWGEYRDRRKRWQYAESRSKLTPVEREKARLLQREYKTRSCPICLETFENGAPEEEEEEQQQQNKDDVDHDLHGVDHSLLSDKDRDSTNPVVVMVERTERCTTGSIKRVDSYGIPLHGIDRKKIKLLRCGHIFCESCWKGWVHSGNGNPCICPVCRQDVGKSSKSKRRREQQQQQQRRRGAENDATQEPSNSSLDNNNNNTITSATALSLTPTYGTMGSLPAVSNSTDNNNRNNNYNWTSSNNDSRQEEEGSLLGRGVRLWSSGSTSSTTVFGNQHGGVSDRTVPSNPNEEGNDVEDVDSDRIDTDNEDAEANDDDIRLDFGSPTEASSLLHYDGTVGDGRNRRMWFPRIPRHRF